MKILTKEEEQEHYNATVLGGTMGGVAGLAVGGLGVWAASTRYPAFRHLTLPFRAFLIVSSGTFSAIVSADSYSRAFEKSRNPEQNYTDSQSEVLRQIEATKSLRQRTLDWMGQNRYSLVFGSWVLSLGGAMAFVGRDPYLTAQQKIVQARVYAQGLTVAVIIASLALEAKDKSVGAGRWETVKILDPDDPTHKHIIEKRIHHERYTGEDQWMDMVAAEEDRIKEREQALKKREQSDEKKGKKINKKDHEHPERGDVEKSKLNAP